MPEAERTLEVWCFGRLAGMLVDGSLTPGFAYAESWVDSGMPPLSQSLPLDGAFSSEAVGAFFGGLLPESVPRDLLARRLGVSGANDFALLSAVAGDTAGAISLQPPGEPPGASTGEIEWLDDDALTRLIDELPTRPMHADEDGGYRLSLAGAQDKLPVIVDRDGRVGLTKGQTPSTHILKTPIARLDDTVVNEGFCLGFGRALGLDVATATPRRVRGREFLLVTRYDRRDDETGVLRLHQEDFCQAFGIPTQRKYQAEGGPSLADCFALLRSAAAVPAREIVKLLDAIALSFLVGNHDAHGKNYSLLYLPEDASAVLAPAYDVLSTFAYHRKHNLSRKMAMSIGGEYRPDYLAPRHLDRLLADAGLGAAAARRRLLGHAEAAPRVGREVRDAFKADGWDAPVLERVIELIDQRAEILRELATSPAARRR
ncbi:type II toxin-antitoxin system HipA family toxin [Baekduia sp. Peel2402]|uniref:type II toxin-antitoxin system HipA family toxin n=1 Tax=Baekduia sp. Peel2402 TaxID=3458296 RepID=UPI00403E89A3